MKLKDNEVLLKKIRALAESSVSINAVAKEADIELTEAQSSRLGEQLNSIANITIRMIRNIQLAGGFIKLDDKEE